MNQEERLDYLLKEFILDSDYNKNIDLANCEKRSTLRALMNIRLPKKMDKKTLEIQDEFLTQEIKEKGIINIEKIDTIEDHGSLYKYASKISLYKGDITKLSIDAIVNAANENLLGCFIPCHKCIDNAIHSAAGIQLRDECYEIMKQEKLNKDEAYTEPTGKSKITNSYNLPCKAIIHTVGPIVRNGLNEDLKKDLKNCYISALKCLIDNGYRSIAFCCISTGEFKFPNKEAALIAANAVFEFLEDNNDRIDRIVFNLFKDIDEEIYNKIFLNKI